MKSEVGLWIDHRKAVMVTVEKEGDTNAKKSGQVTHEIRSNMEKHVRFSSGTHSKGPKDIKGSVPEDMRDRKFDDHLGRYYEGVISLLRDADSIWIFGPGEAKIELENRLKLENLGDRIVGVEAVDKMTNQQIEAKVRDHFAKERDL